ncbi:MAG: hypothetical protein ABEK50_05215, partial [bacterium]
MQKYVFLSDQDPLLYRMFQVHLRTVTIRRMQVLYAAIAVLLVVFWPEDFILNKPYQLKLSFAFWRTFSLFGLGIAVFAFEYVSVIRENPNAIYALLMSADMMVGGASFGAVESFTYPWFDFMVLIFPTYSLVMSLPLLTRFLITNLWTALFVFSWVNATTEP